ncbi:MAG: isoquinoline 1-oxidoreductase beta subunit [Cyclobacteriaceae bacterium]|jgi:isoquinoline 1-oxidoreductase beta subunit
MKNIIEKSLIKKIDRRGFLKTGSIASTGLIIGLHVSCTSKIGEEDRPAASFEPNVYLTINEKGEITIIAHRTEMGQGIRTALPTIVADELEADWKNVSVVQAVADEKYGDQNTDGSYSVRMFYAPLRKAGATARLMLEQAAANKWKVDVSECKAKNSEVIHEASGKKIDFGALADDASKLRMPAEKDIKLKDASEFKLIGKSTPIVDLKDILQGKATYGIDMDIPGLKYAVIARPPVAGGKVASYNAENALKVPGVIRVEELETPGFPVAFTLPAGGVAVIAENTWAAIKGREALDVKWNDGPNADFETSAYLKELERDAKRNGIVKRDNGNIDESIKKATTVLESTFLLPHLSHAPMETPNATADFKNGKCEVWAPAQNPQLTRQVVADALEVDKEAVTMNITLLGGGFGRKSKPDFAVESAILSKKCAMPIKVTWTRDDDLHLGFNHSCSAQYIKVGIDDNNKVTTWNHRSVYPPIDIHFNPKAEIPAMWELSLGFLDMPYDIPNVRCETNKTKAKSRTGWLRSVSHIQHAFAVCTMVDEIAYARRMDPLDNILDLIGPDRNIEFDKLFDGYPNSGEPIADFPWETARMKNVVNLVAEKSGWGKTMPVGSGLGIATHKNHLTYVACVIEVKVENGNITIPEIHYAVDCGTVVNEDRVISQFEGGAIFAISGALGEITFKDGKVEQNNFDTFRVARMGDAPTKINVHLVESNEKPTGVGEPPVPTVAPALCNAIFAATGKRLRKLPIDLS